ncbi:MAG: PPK2 family polyphosphate kinase [Thermomicrobiales bacterium]
MSGAIVVKPGKAIHLVDIDPAADGGLSKRQGEEKSDGLAAELGDLQELLYAAGRQSVLVVLQGLDASGKDGSIRSVFKSVNPSGCRVASFKVPTPLEEAHDFLWRIHKETPEKGMLTVFNRSHYEEVLVVRVHELEPERVWRPRYEHINAFEKLLVDSGTIVLKFYLHISKREQEERLVAREQETTKAWKLSAADWVERRSWESYIQAYEDAIDKCSTKRAPWHVVPADRKWHRNLVITETIVETLRPYKNEWLKSLKERGDAELAAIRKARAEHKGKAA